MSKLLFSHSYYYKLDSKQWNNKTPFPPLGTLYAASLLRQEGYEVGFFDTNLRDSSIEIRDIINKENPKYLVIYDDGFNYLTKMCLTNMREACFEMIKIAKQENCTVIVSSSDSTDHFEKYLVKGADFIILGEAENTLKSLIKSLEEQNTLSEIPGLAYFSNDKKLIVQGKGKVLTDLDSLPQPAWDLINIEEYRKIWKQGNKEFTLNIATTRGCPYKCNWCAKPIYGNRYNSHSPLYIVEQIKYLKQNFGVSKFWMCDDIFGLKPNWVKEFNLILKQNNLKISYHIQSRVDLLLEENTIEELNESGCKEIWVGAESGSQKILDAMDKGTKVEEIYEASKLLKIKGIRVAFFLQFGYPSETFEDILKTISMVKTLRPDDLGISVSYPLPGTKFYEKVKAELGQKSNWKDSDDLDLMFRGTFSREFYKRLQRYIHKEFRINYALNQLKKFSFSKKALKSYLKLTYYIPSAIIDKFKLKKMSYGS